MTCTGTLSPPVRRARRAIISYRAQEKVVTGIAPGLSGARITWVLSGNVRVVTALSLPNTSVASSGGSCPAPFDMGVAVMCSFENVPSGLSVPV